MTTPLARMERVEVVSTWTLLASEQAKRERSFLYLFGRFSMGFGHDRFERDGFAPLPLALIRRLHEGHNLQRFSVAHGLFMRDEEGRDLFDEGFIAFEAEDGGDFFGAEDHRAVLVGDAAEDADAGV